MAKNVSSLRVALYAILVLFALLLPIGAFQLGILLGTFSSLQDGVVVSEREINLTLKSKSFQLPEGVVVHEIDVPGHQKYYALIFKSGDPIGSRNNYPLDDLVAAYQVETLKRPEAVSSKEN